MAIKESVFTKIASLVDEAVLKSEIAGLNLVIKKNGEEVFYYEHGYADLEDQHLIKRDSIFRLYSMTKPVTAGGVMLLMERGQIDLFDPVSKYLPLFKEQMVVGPSGLVSPTKDLSIFDLLNMTSGLSYPGQGLSGESAEKVFDAINDSIKDRAPMTTLDFANAMAKTPLAFQPGTSWMYGSSADVLGAIIELVDGRNLRDFFVEEFFQPLGMNDTDFYVPGSKQDRLAKVYEDDPKKGLKLYQGNYLAIRNAMAQVPAFLSGGAGLCGTLDDYGKYAEMLLNGGTYEGRQLLSPSTVQFMTSHELTEDQNKAFSDWHTLAGHSYGNLMRVVNQPDRAGCFVRQGEYGWDGWLGCYFANFPDCKMTLVMMMQKKDAGTTDLTRKIRNVLLGGIEPN